MMSLRSQSVAVCARQGGGVSPTTSGCVHCIVSRKQRLVRNYIKIVARRTGKKPRRVKIHGWSYLGTELDWFESLTSIETINILRAFPIITPSENPCSCIYQCGSMSTHSPCRHRTPNRSATPIHECARGGSGILVVWQCRAHFWLWGHSRSGFLRLQLGS